jgi:hypothetical protein
MFQDIRNLAALYEPTANFTVLFDPAVTPTATP